MGRSGRAGKSRQVIKQKIGVRDMGQNRREICFFEKSGKGHITVSPP